MIFTNFKVINKLSEQDIVQGQGYQKQQNISVCKVAIAASCTLMYTYL